MIWILNAHRYVVAVSTVALAFSLTAASACDWDTETLLEERSRFPTALEIILGKFPRHTKDYYQWRLNDRLEKLKSSPNDDRLLDDVAVSYEKLEQYDEAITTDPETQREAQGGGGSSEQAFNQLLGSLLVVFILVIIAAFAVFVFWTRHRQSTEPNLNA